MRMIALVKEYPEIFARFLDLSGTSILMVADKDYRLTFCNDCLTQKMHLPEKPLGIFLTSILCTLEDTEFSLLPSERPHTLVPQLFKLCNSDSLYRCYSFKISEGYLVLGDLITSTENEILENMTHLNDQLSAISRELSKKNRELQLANAKISKLARTDYLTGLANRSYFQERLKQTLSLTKRHNLLLAVLLADLDHFKRINDTYGHDVGDKVLQNFGNILADNCRTEDVPARYGGEEFIIMMPETYAKDALALGERLRNELRRSGVLPAPDFITFSAGITEYKEEDTEASLLKRADQALYEAKNKGRDRCIVFS